MSRREGHLGDKGAQNKLRRMDKLADRQVLADLATVMDKPEGRRIVWHIYDELCLGVSAVEDTSNRAHLLNGRKNVGVDLMLLAQRACPEKWVLAYQEALTSKKRDDLLRRSAAATTEESNA